MPPSPSSCCVAAAVAATLVRLLLLLAVIRGGWRGARWCCDATTPPRRGCGFYCRRRRHGVGVGGRWVMGGYDCSGSIVVGVYNNDFSFSDFFVTIRIKKAYQQARGHNAPSPSPAAGAGSVAVAASSGSVVGGSSGASLPGHAVVAVVRNGEVVVRKAIAQLNLQ